MRGTFSRYAAGAVLAVIMLMPILTGGCEQDEWFGGRLDGTKWRLAAWSVSSLHPGEFTITADFNEAKMSGTAAVNHYSGPYTTTVSGSFSLGALTMTEMAGPENAMRAEALYVELLTQAKKYSVSETTLTLFDQNGNQLLIFDKR